MQRMLSAMNRRRAVTNADSITVTDSEAADIRRAREQQALAQPAKPATVADVFASMMSQSGRRAAEAAARQPSAPVQRTAPSVGRNDPCPCGSGKKYKKCCGRNIA